MPQIKLPDFLGFPRFSFTIDGKASIVSIAELPFIDGAYTYAHDGIYAQWKLRAMPFGYTARLTIHFAAPCTLDAFSPLIAAVAYPDGAHAVRSKGIESGFHTLSDTFDITAPAVYLYKDGEGFMARSIYPLCFDEAFHIRSHSGVAEVSLSVTPPRSFTSDTFESAELYFACGRLAPALDEYFTLLPQLWHYQKSIVGYNTWDYYFTDIDEACMEENLSVIDQVPAYRDNLRYFTLDDGWQAIQGDWYPNFRFPHGLQAAADTIRAHGLIPGIWSAPLHVWTLCSYAQRRMTGYLRDEYSNPVTEDGMYVLDPTHPDTVDFIRSLYTRLYDAGFRLYKVDYVGCLRHVKYFYDKTVSQYEALRRLFSLIRECVHDSVIIGCSLPVEAASPDADAGRTGIDIHITWNHVLWAMECYQHHWGEHRRIWVNDIDFLVVRGQNTDTDPQRNTIDPARYTPNHSRWRSGEDFTLAEARSWAAVVLLTGGNMNLSDRLAVLNSEGRSIIEKALSLRSEDSAVPLDQFVRDYPCIWKQGRRYIVINFGESSETFTFSSVKPMHELWTDAVFNPTDGQIFVTLSPHESAVFYEHA
ncbi:MAG: glycoside hydrolase family 36 protein [Clostridiaceae bacterium]|nr:glycoside hydrolase family 36 protein [Clostridiaceae bacterium]